MESTVHYLLIVCSGNSYLNYVKFQFPHLNYVRFLDIRMCFVIQYLVIKKKLNVLCVFENKVSSLTIEFRVLSLAKARKLYSSKRMYLYTSVFFDISLLGEVSQNFTSNGRFDSYSFCVVKLCFQVHINSELLGLSSKFFFLFLCNDSFCAYAHLL